MQHKDKNGFVYETVIGDDTNARIYTLENGLKVYLGNVEGEPKVQTYIAVKTGSNNDPDTNTGLAHYLEHMLFKGTSKMGTLDWEKEKPLLEKISVLYEKHKAEKDPVKKEAIYKEIDKISGKASNYSIANEYDKAVTELGATGTNAYTWLEETVYVNKIPSNAIGKWLTLEYERFGQLVLRLFHTELEAVYEEFNRSQDNDFFKVHHASMEGLFPTHPYGQKRTIGISKHLKNPSMVAIENYFQKYYVPNNMAIIMAGEMDMDKAIAQINDTFGKMKKRPLEKNKFPVEKPITKPIVKEVFGPSSDMVSLSYRSAGTGSDDELLILMSSMLLYNGASGLIDLHLNQAQKVQSANCGGTFFKEYGIHHFTGNPKDGQSLEQVKELILNEIEKIKKGDFEQWMLKAIINDFKLKKQQAMESNSGVADAYKESFVRGVRWEERVKLLKRLENITKKDIIAFANRFYKDNYVVVYKRKGKDDTVVKIKKPSITPVNLNRGKTSVFLKSFKKQPIPALQSKYLDFKKSIEKITLKNGIEVSTIKNKTNDLFSLDIIFDMGKDHDKKTSLAMYYLDYLGTDKYTPSELNQAFYKIGITPQSNVDNDRITISISGLEENLKEGLQLLLHKWKHSVADAKSYKKFVTKIEKSRKNKIANKNSILNSGLLNYAMYGKNSRLRDIYSIEELASFDPKDLVAIAKDLINYEQRFFYYGKKPEKIIAVLNETYTAPTKRKAYPAKKIYQKLDNKGKIYFANYDMVQAELLFVSKSKIFNPKDIANAMILNTYFGSGLSSIVFQEIRESKSLAYAAYAYYKNASKKDQENYIIAYVGTQVNKLSDAINGMQTLLKNMPRAEKQFEAAKKSVLKKIAAERITKAAIFWYGERLKKQGITYDNREEIYKSIEKMTFDDLQKFFDNHIKNKTYDLLLIGNEKDIDFQKLLKIGHVEKMNIKELFNYTE